MQYFCLSCCAHIYIVLLFDHTVCHANKTYVSKKYDQKCEFFQTIIFYRFKYLLYIQNSNILQQINIALFCNLNKNYSNYFEQTNKDIIKKPTCSIVDRYVSLNTFFLIIQLTVPILQWRSFKKAEPKYTFYYYNSLNIKRFQ